MPSGSRAVEQRFSVNTLDSLRCICASSPTRI
jgi:hypothetical protein